MVYLWCRCFVIVTYDNMNKVDTTSILPWIPPCYSNGTQVLINISLHHLGVWMVCAIEPLSYNAFLTKLSLLFTVFRVINIDLLGPTQQKQCFSKYIYKDIIGWIICYLFLPTMTQKRQNTIFPISLFISCNNSGMLCVKSIYFQGEMSVFITPKQWSVHILAFFPQLQMWFGDTCTYLHFQAKVYVRVLRFL